MLSASFFPCLGLWEASLYLLSRVQRPLPPPPYRHPPPPRPLIFRHHIPSRQQPPTHPAFFLKRGCRWPWPRISFRCRFHGKTAATGRSTACSTRLFRRQSSGSSRSFVCRTPSCGRSIRGEKTSKIFLEVSVSRVKTFWYSNRIKHNPYKL